MKQEIVTKKLNTQEQDVFGAINELKVAVENASGGGGVSGFFEYEISSISFAGEFDLEILETVTIDDVFDVKQVAGNYTNKGDLKDESNEMILCNGIAKTANIITVFWQSLGGPIVGNFKFYYKKI